MTEDAWPRALPNPIGLNADWFRHCAAGELRFQRCGACSAWRHPPRVLCASCGCGQWSWELSNGRGRVFSWTVTHQPVYAAFADVVPYAVVVAELDEGVRIVSNLRGSDPAVLALDLPVEVEIERVNGDIGLPYLRVVTQSR